MIFHALFIGSTGAGKTNALLYWLRRLFSDRKDVASSSSTRTATPP
jgi:type II secretory ATPase GspE/PulE/Tfp pilus assembly ATPase PilB-like protein